MKYDNFPGAKNDVAAAMDTIAECYSTIRQCQRFIVDAVKIADDDFHTIDLLRNAMMIYDTSTRDAIRRAIWASNCRRDIKRGDRRNMYDDRAS